MLDSSTPDGLAPLSDLGLMIFIFTFSAVSFIWGAFNFLKILNIGPDQDTLIIKSDHSVEIQEMGQKILLGSLTFMKFNLIVTTAFTLFFLIAIMWAVQLFDSFDISISYLIGVVIAIICSFYTIITASLSYYRIVYSAKYSSQAFTTAKTASNAITYFCLGLILASLMGLLIFIQSPSPSTPQQINHISDILVSFCLGLLTLSMSTKIISLTYLKGIQNSFKVASSLNITPPPSTPSNPMILCKCIGQTINKSLSKTLDYLCFFGLTVAFGMKSAGFNIVGTDQNGEIVFTLAKDNGYSALLLLAFALFFTILLTIYQGTPETADQVKFYFRINIVGLTILLSGFTALACYLTLPAEFQIMQFIKENIYDIKSPVYAYLCVLIGMAVSLVINFGSQIYSTSPYFVYSLMSSCMTGTATCLISGLSDGYFFNFLPSVVIGSFGFLCYFWLGTFGLSMGAVGFAIYIPYYLNVSLYHSIMNTTSMIGYVNKVDQNVLQCLMNLNESKKYYQQKVLIHYHTLSSILGYTSLAVFVQATGLQFSISQPMVFSGLLMGSMFPYILSYRSIQSSFNIAPVICYDIQQQIDQNQETQSNKQINFDSLRSNSIFLLSSAMQIIKYLPILMFPNIVMALSFGVKAIFGLMAGLLLSSLQLAISSVIAGALWTNLNDQIQYGRAKDQDMNQISVNSQQGKAAEISKTIGNSLKDSAGQTAHIFTFWIFSITHVFLAFYLRLES